MVVLVALDARPIVVATTADHEFDLVVGLQAGNVVPVTVYLCRVRGLYIQHFDDSGIHSVYRERAAGFQRNRKLPVHKRGHKRKDAWLG